MNQNLLLRSHSSPGLYQILYNVPMPKNKKLSLKIDILHPQSQPQKIPVRLLRWLLQAGRYLIVIVEIVVLAAFVSRFKLDNDIAQTKDEIDNKAPFIKSLKPDEILIKKLKFQLTTIKDLKSKQADFADILSKIASETPSGVSLSNLSFEDTAGSVNIKLTGVAQNNDQLATFVFGLRSENTFSGINIAAVALEQGLINFTLNFQGTKGGFKS